MLPLNIILIWYTAAACFFCSSNLSIIALRKKTTEAHPTISTIAIAIDVPPTSLTYNYTDEQNKEDEEQNGENYLKEYKHYIAAYLTTATAL